VRWHLASVKSLCPFGQPEKALGHEPQIDPWLPHRTTTRLASFRTRSASSLLMKMHLLRWINPRHNTPRASSIANGLDVANQTRASRRREKNVLDMPSYRAGHGCCVNVCRCVCLILFVLLGNVRALDKPHRRRRRQSSLTCPELSIAFCHTFAYQVWLIAYTLMPVLVHSAREYLETDIVTSNCCKILIALKMPDRGFERNGLTSPIVNLIR
jgi:hypothetical protein